MGVKQTQEVPSSLPQDQLEGVADEEWVGHVTKTPPSGLMHK